MRTKAEIIGLIEETVAYYGSDPENRRAIEEGTTGTCLYATGDGKHCAVGRCFNDLGLEEFGERRASFDTILGSQDNLDEYFKDQYKGFSNTTWNNLQQLHDTNKFWRESGLSTKGRAYVDELLRLAGEGTDIYLSRHDFL